MNKVFSHLKSAASPFAAVLVGLLIFAPVMAAPSGNPPSSNVDPNFSSISTGVIKNLTGSVNINSSQGLYVMDNNGLSGFKVSPSGDFYAITTVNGSYSFASQGNIANTMTSVSNSQLSAPFSLKNASNQTVFNIAVDGDLSNSTAGTPLTLTDPDGVSIDTTASTGLSVSASGANSIGGRFIGTNTAVYAEANTASGIGVHGTGKGAGSGVAGYNSDENAMATGVYGQARKAGGTMGYGGRFLGDGYGVKGTTTSSTGRGGYFGSNGEVHRVELGTPTEAITAFGNMSITGHIKAAGGFGNYTVRTASTTVGSGLSGSVTTPCSGSEQAISCGYWTSNSGTGWQLNYLYPTAGSCVLSSKNTNGGTYTLYGYAMCLNPNV